MTLVEQIFPYVLVLVGIVGFELAGRRIWWAWHVNIANQILWFIFAWITGYWGFFIGAFFYTYQFIRNAYKWTKDRDSLRKAPDEYVKFGTVVDAHVQYGRPATVQVESIGMYLENTPREGTTAYFKRGE